MPVTLSIKNVPDELAEILRARAARNHRSLQGEMLAILERATTGMGVETQRLSMADALAELDRIGLRTPSESVRMIREDRDSRQSRGR